MFENIKKSASKILGFCIFIVCSVYAFKHVSLEALNLGVVSSILLIGSKTAIAGAIDILKKGKK